MCVLGNSLFLPDLSGGSREAIDFPILFFLIGPPSDVSNSNKKLVKLVFFPLTYLLYYQVSDFCFSFSCRNEE